jgi:hypothetical protein
MTARALIVPLLATTALACSHGSGGSKSDPAAQPRPAATDAPPRTGAAPPMCPMDLPGTQLTAADTATGEALTFTTTPDQTAALRERVRALAAMHDQHGATRGSGTTASGRGGMGGMPMPPPSHTTVEDVDNGARMVVTPNDPADLAKLQSTVKMHAEHMQQMGCGPMGHGGPQQ